MKTPLFFVSCTTCGARIRFFDEGRLGQIIPCPKCGSMVLVEKQEVPENGENTKIVESTVKSEAEKRGTEEYCKDTGTKSIKAGQERTEAEWHEKSKEGIRTEVGTEKSVEPLSGTETTQNIPVPPALPTSVNHAVNEYPEEMRNKESKEEEFRFEGETETGWSPRALIWGTVGIAGGVFLVGITLFFLLGAGEKSKNPSLALKIPAEMEENETIPKDGKEVEHERDSETEENTEEQGVTEEVTETKVGGNTDKDANDNNAGRGNSSDDSNGNTVEMVDGLTVSENPKGSNGLNDLTNLEDLEKSDGNLSGFMQSDVGKILSEEL
ncbi:MAG: hypothetical protein Q4C70_11485, partial [Planctomycetia bacterium]|nr:hypothetical protein [Planctomycetia bacterium]